MNGFCAKGWHRRGSGRKVFGLLVILALLAALAGAILLTAGTAGAQTLEEAPPIADPAAEAPVSEPTQTTETPVPADDGTLPQEEVSAPAPDPAPTEPAPTEPVPTTDPILDTESPAVEPAPVVDPTPDPVVEALPEPAPVLNVTPAPAPEPVPVLDPAPVVEATPIAVPPPSETAPEAAPVTETTVAPPPVTESVPVAETGPTTTAAAVPAPASPVVAEPAPAELAAVEPVPATATAPARAPSPVLASAEVPASSSALAAGPVARTDPPSGTPAVPPSGPSEGGRVAFEGSTLSAAVIPDVAHIAEDGGMGGDPLSTGSPKDRVTGVPESLAEGLVELAGEMFSTASEEAVRLTLQADDLAAGLLRTANGPVQDLADGGTPAVPARDVPSPATPPAPAPVPTGGSSSSCGLSFGSGQCGEGAYGVLMLGVLAGLFALGVSRGSTWAFDELLKPKSLLLQVAERPG